jgi:hypothetical protein
VLSRNKINNRYSLANEKTAELFKDIRVYRGAELNMDFFLCTKLQFPPRWKAKTATSLTEEMITHHRQNIKLDY